MKIYNTDLDRFLANQPDMSNKSDSSSNDEIIFISETTSPQKKISMSTNESQLKDEIEILYEIRNNTVNDTNACTTSKRKRSLEITSQNKILNTDENKTPTNLSSPKSSFSSNDDYVDSSLPSLDIDNVQVKKSKYISQPCVDSSPLPALNTPLSTLKPNNSQITQTSNVSFKDTNNNTQLSVTIPSNSRLNTHSNVYNLVQNPSTSLQNSYPPQSSQIYQQNQTTKHMSNNLNSNFVRESRQTTQSTLYNNPQQTDINTILYKYPRNNPSIQFETGSLLNGISDILVQSNEITEISYKYKIICNRELSTYDSISRTYPIITTTSPSCTQFNCIYNVTLANFNYLSDESELHYKNTLTNVLKLAISNNCKIISLPVMGINLVPFNYPFTLCTKWIDECLREFFISTTIHSLVLIRIIINKNYYIPAHDYFTKKESIVPIINLFDRPNDEFRLISVDQASEEFQLVSNHFLLTMRNCKINKIDKIENIFLRTMYDQSKNILKKRNQSNRPLEYKLFHGTSINSTNSICKYGFNRSYVGKNGTNYGQGVYFARDASYSHSYVKRGIMEEIFKDPKTYQMYPYHLYANNSIPCLLSNSLNNCVMIMSRVLVGEYQLGNSNMRDPDTRPDGNQYDSTVDNLQSPSIFVIYRDYRAYPDYIIYYSITK